MQATDSLPADTLTLLHSTIARVEGAYAPATVRAYFADFSAFIAFCDLNNQLALPANAVITAEFIRHISFWQIIGQYPAGDGNLRRPSFKSPY